MQREYCCECGGGNFRRFDSIPVQYMVNPLYPYEPTGDVEIVNAGTNYEVGDRLRLFSNSVPDATNAEVVVTEIFHPAVHHVPKKDTCRSTCAAHGAVCTTSVCDESTSDCSCGSPGDPRQQGSLLKVRVISGGFGYEKGSQIYQSSGGSGHHATFRVHNTNIRGEIPVPPHRMDTHVIRAIILGSLQAQFSRAVCMDVPTSLEWHFAYKTGRTVYDDDYCTAAAIASIGVLQLQGNNRQWWEMYNAVFEHSHVRLYVRVKYVPRDTRSNMRSVLILGARSMRNICHSMGVA